MTRHHGMAVLLALTATACGSVSHHVAADVPAPTTIAVLPVPGPAPAGLRDAARQLLHSRLVARGYRCPELAWVDRVLSEHGWLGDADRFVPDAARLPEVLAALQADAALVADGLDESSFNVILLRRHAVGGRVAIRDATGRTFWSSDHGASTFGGFLLTSGQVFAELRAQGEHGTPMASLALVDEFVADVVGTVPLRETAAAPAAPTVAAVVARRTAPAPGTERVVVTARASTGATLRCDLEPFVRGVPMVASTADATAFVGQYDVPAGTTLQRVVVHARDAWGREATGEGAP